MGFGFGVAFWAVDAWVLYRTGQRERQRVGGDQPHVLRAEQLPPGPAAVVEVEQAKPRKVAVRDPEPTHRPCPIPNLWRSGLAKENTREKGAG